MTTPTTAPAATAADAAGDSPDGMPCPPGEHRMPDGSCMPDEQMGGQLDALPGEHFHTTVMEGVSTGMREFAPGAITWREPPFAYHWQAKSSAHSGVPETVQVGLVTRVVRDAETVHFFGRLDLRSDEGLDYARQLVEGFARWSSVGADESFRDSDVELVFPAGGPAELIGADERSEPVLAEPEGLLIRRYRVAEVSGVSVPALADATVEPTGELVAALAEMGVVPDRPDGDAMVAAAVAVHHTAISDDTTWDSDENLKRLPSPMPLSTAQAVFAEVDDTRAGDGMVAKDAGSFPHHTVSADGTPGAANTVACTSAIGAMHGGRSGQRTGSREAYNHVRAHLLDSGREPDSIPAFTVDAAPVVAAHYTVTIPDLPAAAWFDEPADDDMPEFGELRINEQGRIWGLLAPKYVAHRSFARRVEVPMGRVDYSGWMNKQWPVAEGNKIYTGVITMECGHASTNPGDHSYTHRREHYDNSCSIAAHARIGEKTGGNIRGVWVAGALAPWVDAERLGKLMSCQLSGDWDTHKDRPGWQDFIAALLVPVEGFPKRVPAASVRVADGKLVASAVPVRFVGPQPELRPTLERIARDVGRDTTSRMAALHARVHPDGR